MKRRTIFRRIFSLTLCIFMLFASFPAEAASTDSRVRNLLNKMSLEEKIAQMLMPAIRSWTDAKGNTVPVTSLPAEFGQAITELGLGGVILFSENLTTTKGGAGLIYDMQKAAGASALGIPLLVSVDQEGGTVSRLGTGTTMPGNMALGATGDPANAYLAASVMASELAAMGFNVNFGPDLDVNNNPNNPVIGLRSFSDDPAQCAAFGAEYIRGMHKYNIATAVKHFPGHGDTATDSHSGLPSINKSLAEIKAFELIPFAEGIRAGTDLVTTAHIQYPQIEKTTYRSISTGESITLPATLSKTIITGLLRGTLGFEGVVTTDALGMGAIAQHFAPLDAARLAINAGVDILLMPVTISKASDIGLLKDYIDGIASMVKKGVISVSTVNAAVTRILTLKENRGILSAETQTREQKINRALSVMGSHENHETEWEIAKKAVTLVKNDMNTLPVSLPKYGKIVMFFPYPNEVTAAKYAFDRLKSEGILDKSITCNIYCYQNHAYTEYADEIRTASVIIGSAEAYGQATLYSGNQPVFLDGLITSAHAAGKKVIVLSSHLPYDLARYQKADALAAVYSSVGMNKTPVSYSGETVTWGPNISAGIYMLLGGGIPTGQLPVNIPKLSGSYRFTDTTLYSRFYGLSRYGQNFLDVSPDAYYANAVRWAADNGITAGTGDGNFSPDRVCTRAEAVTFFWRFAGKPLAHGDISFRDVPADAYYAQAVKWAAETGLTVGTGDGCFSPDAVCDRSQVVSLLYRFAGNPKPTKPLSFPDVPGDSYFADAVRWAAEKGIVVGTGNGEFSPYMPCTRSQIAALLERIN